MKYLLDEKGNIVIRDGKPVVVDDAGKESTIDAIGNQLIIANLHKESAGHRKDAEKYKVIVDQVGDMDLDAAQAALSTVASMSDQHKLDLDTLKKEMNTTWETKFQKETDRSTKLEGDLFEATVTSQFATSETLKTTVLTPDIAAKFFGGHFQLDGSAKDAAGNTIFSKEKPGEPAKFDEALSIIIDNYPGKASILKGSGASGGGSHLAGKGADYKVASAYYDKKSKQYNLTEQAKIAKTDPELHKQLQAEHSSE